MAEKDKILEGASAPGVGATLAELEGLIGVAYKLAADKRNASGEVFQAVAALKTYCGHLVASCSSDASYLAKVVRRVEALTCKPQGEVVTNRFYIEAVQDIRAQTIEARPMTTKVLDMEWPASTTAEASPASSPKSLSEGTK